MTTDKEILLAQNIESALEEIANAKNEAAFGSAVGGLEVYAQEAAEFLRAQAASLPSPDGETPISDAASWEDYSHDVSDGEVALVVSHKVSARLERELNEANLRADDAQLSCVAAEEERELLRRQLTEANASIAAMQEEMDSAQDILCAALPRGLVHDRGGLLPHAKQVAAELSRHSSIASDAATAPAEAAGTANKWAVFLGYCQRGAEEAEIAEQKNPENRFYSGLRSGYEIAAEWIEEHSPLAATPQPAINVPEGWIPVEERLPVVELGQELHCFVAAKRKHNGKVYVFDLWYVNRPDSEDNPNGIEGEDGEKLNCVGWFNIGCNSGYDEFYMPADNESEIFAWQPIALPAAPSAPAVGVGADS